MPEIGEIKKGNEIGKTRSKIYIWQACADCKVERWTRMRKGEPIARYCNRCSGAHVNGKGSACHSWQGGYRRMTSGYVLVWVGKDDFFSPMAGNKGYVREHRLIMAKHLKRCLLAWEVVHHRNGIKADNRIENLELISARGKHNTLINKRIKQLERRVTFLEAENVRLQSILGQPSVLRQAEEILRRKGG